VSLPIITRALGGAVEVLESLDAPGQLALVADDAILGDCCDDVIICLLTYIALHR